MKEVGMFKSIYTRLFQYPSSNITPSDNERRIDICRRENFDIKYLGLGKCIDRRKEARRKADQFDKEAYEQRCKERLGPGWL